MAERPRLLVLDLLESYARERNIDVRLQRRHDLDRWFCVLSGPPGKGFVRGSGGTAREAVRDEVWSDDDPRAALEIGDVVAAPVSPTS